jgi:hypothetical protein
MAWASSAAPSITRRQLGQPADGRRGIGLDTAFHVGLHRDQPAFGQPVHDGSQAWGDQAS